jgi:hypothetical protein
METSRAVCLAKWVVLLAAVFYFSPAEAQTAFGSSNGQCNIHNACWQALKIPRSTEGPTGSIGAQLDACKGAGGPDAYFGRRVEGLRLCRILNGTIVFD